MVGGESGGATRSSKEKEAWPCGEGGGWRMEPEDGEIKRTTT